MISRRLYWPRYAPLPTLIRYSPTHGNRSRATDLLHREHRAHIRTTRAPYEALVALIITRNISELELQQIVHIPAGTVKLDDFRHRAHCGGKVLKPFFRMLASSHQDERGNAYPELRWVEKSNPLENDPFSFKVFDSVPARIRREVHLFGNIRERLRRINLQTLQDSAIRAVQSRHGKISHQV